MILDRVIKGIFINIYAIIIVLKMNNYKGLEIKDKILMFGLIMISTIAYVLCGTILDFVTAVLVICLIETIYFRFIIKINIPNIILSTVIANSISCIIGALCSMLEFIIQRLFLINLTTVNLIITEIFEGILIFFIFRIKRLKKGLNFLKNENEYMEVTTINVCLILAFMYGLIGFASDQVYKYLLIHYVIFGLLMLYIIQKAIILHYKQKLLDDTITDYKNQIIQKDSEIKRLTEENFKINKINHEFNQRQNALELMVKEHIQKYNFEAGEDNDILNRVEQLTAEHSNKMQEIKSIEELPLTEIKEIDDMFAYMQKECADRNIDFKLKINGNIFYMINNLISVNSLETLIGDHIRDAIIAVESSNNKHREIFAILGQKDSNYEFCVYDTGIDFELDTFSKLGIEPATTHKDAGGTGIGFITTFETLKKCNASIEIEELKDSEYSKCVKFIFDDKNEYIIKSYRAEEINAINKNSRIIVCS